MITFSLKDTLWQDCHNLWKIPLFLLFHIPFFQFSFLNPFFIFSIFSYFLWHISFKDSITPLSVYLVSYFSLFPSVARSLSENRFDNQDLFQILTLMRYSGRAEWMPINEKKISYINITWILKTYFTFCFAVIWQSSSVKERKFISYIIAPKTLLFAFCL